MHSYIHKTYRNTVISFPFTWFYLLILNNPQWHCSQIRYVAFIKRSNNQLIKVAKGDYIECISRTFTDVETSIHAEQNPQRGFSPSFPKLRHCALTSYVNHLHNKRGALSQHN